MQSFYVDTCIYLNLWKKETNLHNVPIWVYAKNFFEFVGKENSTIFYSGFILKEIMFLLSTEDYLIKRDFFESSSVFKKVSISQEEYSLAIKIKKDIKSNCSLFDIIHLIIAKKTSSILITRDEELINLSNYFGIKSQKPEEIIGC